MTSSRGALIFDTTAMGAGVEVFQPFEAGEGQLSLASSTVVEDGDKTLSINVETLQPDQQVSFTIDVDDTLENSSLGQIRVTGSEMQGGTVSVSTHESKTQRASFNSDSRAVISGVLCS